MRNLTKTIAAISLLVPTSAFPLGIGDIKLHSALNQKLDAEIALILSANESISDIKVKLASPEKFDESGVPWSYFLSKIKFKAVTLPNGATVVKLSSHEALREPFLDFLLEVTWATGNMYREFTVLVDPPVAYTQPIIPVIQQPQQAMPSYAVRPANTSNRPVRRSSRNRIVDGQYGPTGRTDYLWKIAKRTNVHDDISVEQMMMALYEANPDAFYKPNVNALMAGKTLNIPERDAVLKLSRKQAIAAYKQQDNIWRGRVSKKAQQVTVDETELASQLELEAPVAGEIAQTVKAVAGVTKDALPADIVKPEVSDSSLTASSEGLALQARMEKLEQQLAMMQKMLALKDEQIAVLQNKKVVAPVANPIVEPAKVDTTEVAKQPKATTETVVKETKTPPVVKAAPKKPKPKPVIQPAPEPEGVFDYLTLLLGGLGAAILGVLGWMWWRRRESAGGGLDNESVFASASELSLPEDTPEDELTIPVEDDFSDFETVSEGESSFLSAFTPSDFDAFDADQNEVDPISEADVYLAYGRYQQAEDLMRQAIEDYPERDECKLKLLEIYHTNENKESFDKYAEELASAGKQADAGFWTKVTEMGLELSPDSSIYKVDNTDFETADLEAVLEEDEQQEIDLDDIQDVAVEGSAEQTDFDLSAFDDEGDNLLGAVAEGGDENALDFDLSVFDADNKDDGAILDARTGEEADDVESIDFDLGSDSGDSKPEKIEIDEVKSPVEEIESVDFDLGADSVESEIADIDLSAEPEADIDLDSFELSLNDEAEEKAVESSETVAESTDDGVEEFDFDFDAEVEIPASEAKPVTELDVGVSDLTDMDELETKLDLARAYIDMGDTQAAIDIAEEVLEKGDEEQKKAAQDVLDQLKT